MSKSANDLLLLSRQYLSTIFGNNSLLAKLESDKSFAETISKAIGIQNNLENILEPEIKLTTKYLDNFKKHTKLEIDLKQYEHIIDLDDIQDEINYLNVMVKNLFDQKDLTEFTINANNDVILDKSEHLNTNSDKTEEAEIKSTDSKEESKKSFNSSETEEVEPLHGQKISGSNFRNKQDNFSSNNFQAKNQWNPGFGAFPFGNSQQSADLLYRAAAAKRLEYEMQIGKIYRWKQKPRAVHILQYVAFVAALLFTLAGLAVLIAWIYAGSNQLQLKTTNTSGDSSFSNLNGGQIFSFMITPLFLMIFGINMMFRYYNDAIGRISPFKKSKLQQLISSSNKNESWPKINQNLQYHFYYNSIIYATFGIIFFGLMPGIFNTPLTILTNINSFGTFGNPEIGFSNSIVMPIFVTNIVFLGLFFPLILIAILGKLLNPKQDLERIEQILTTYIDELKKEGKDPITDGAFGGPMGGFGRGPFSF